MVIRKVPFFHVFLNFILFGLKVSFSVTVERQRCISSRGAPREQTLRNCAVAPETRGRLTPRVGAETSPTLRAALRPAARRFPTTRRSFPVPFPSAGPDPVPPAASGCSPWRLLLFHLLAWFLDSAWRWHRVVLVLLWPRSARCPLGLALLWPMRDLTRFYGRVVFCCTYRGWRK